MPLGHGNAGMGETDCGGNDVMFVQLIAKDGCRRAAADKVRAGISRPKLGEAGPAPEGLEIAEIDHQVGRRPPLGCLRVLQPVLGVQRSSSTCTGGDLLFVCLRTLGGGMDEADMAAPWPSGRQGAARTNATLGRRSHQGLTGGGN